MERSENFNIAILSYNHPELTARAIRSALSKSRPENTILIHNGSEPKHIQSLREEFSQIRHFVTSNNRGYSGGVNEALRRGFETQDWVLFMTNDTWLDCESIVIPQEPGIFIPQIMIRSTDKVDSLGGLFSPRHARLQHCWSAEGWEQIPKGTYRYVPGSAFLMHKSVFDEVGEFDEKLGTYWEDVDYSMRAQQQGHKLVLYPSLVLRHGVGKTCRQDSLYTIYYYHRNRRWISFKYSYGVERVIVQWSLLKAWVSDLWRLARRRRWSDIPVLFKALKKRTI